MIFSVISCSLNPNSRSRILARRALAAVAAQGRQGRWIDLRERPLPLCDGATAYQNASVGALETDIRNSGALLVAVPIYNYDANAAAKNLLEMTGAAWENKIVGFLCAAGGQSSYMSIMSLANSLMLDYRCIIVPRFVYASGNAFKGDQIVDDDVLKRIDELTDETIRIGEALGAR